MAYTERTSTDLVIGSGHPRYSDTKNSACIELYTLLEVEHTDGMHDDRAYAMTGEIDTYTGDGQSSQTITLTNTDLTPRLIIIWFDTAAQGVPEKLSNMSGNNGFLRPDTNFGAYITIGGIGEFTVNLAAFNANGTTYYYCVLGIDITSTYSYVGGANDPDWVEDAELGSADGTGSSVCDKVEEAIDTGIDAEHNGTTGVHDTPPFSGFAKIEVGSWTGTSDDDVVTLEDDALDIKYGFYFRDAIEEMYSASETMSATDSKKEATAAFSANGFQSLGTGTFTAKTASTDTYYYCVIGV